MSRVTPIDEGPFAPAWDQRPVSLRLQGVVVGAQEVKEIRSGVVGLGPIDSMVPLQSGSNVATLDRAGWVHPFEGGLLVGARSTAQVGDAAEFVGLGQDGGNEWVAGRQQVFDSGHGDRSVADQLAGLAGQGGSSQEAVEIHPNDHLHLRSPVSRALYRERGRAGRGLFGSGD